MATAIEITANYRQEKSMEAVQTTEQAAVTFVPELVDVRTPTRRIVRGLQFRRQFVDFFAGFVSGAASLR